MLAEKSTKEELRGAQSILRLAIFLLSVVILASLLINHILLQRTAANVEQTLILVSSRPLNADEGILALSRENQRLVYSRSDSAYGTAVARSAEVDSKSIKNLLLVVTNAKGIDYSSQNITEIEVQLDVIRSEVMGLVFPTSLALSSVAVLMGLLFSRYFTGNIKVILLFAAISSSYQLANECTFCEPVLILGVKASVLGIIVYSLLLLGLSTHFATKILSFIPAVTGVVVLWQLSMIWNGHSACLPCAIILSCNFILLAASALHPPHIATTRGVTSFVSNYAFPLFCITSFGLQMLKADADSLANEQPTEKSLTAPRKWEGRMLAELGVRPDNTLKPYVMIVTIPGCPPCEKALSYLRSSFFTIRNVELIV